MNFSQKEKEIKEGNEEIEKHINEEIKIITRNIESMEFIKNKRKMRE